MNSKVILALSLILSLTASGCVSSSSQDECAYGSCGEYQGTPEIDGWDIFGPFALMLLGGIGVGLLIFVAVRAGNRTQESPPEIEVDAEQP